MDEAKIKRTTRSAAALQARTDVPSEPPEAQRSTTEDKVTKIKEEVKDTGSTESSEAAPKVKDVTQSLRDANRAREVSSKVKEVAKFKEVASKLKEVASKVKEVNTKVKEVTSKIKEEVTKEEQSSRVEEEAKEEEQRKQESEKNGKEKDDKSESPVKAKLEILEVGKPMLVAARGHGVDINKTPLVALEKAEGEGKQEKASNKGKEAGELGKDESESSLDDSSEKKETVPKAKGGKKKDWGKAKKDSEAEAVDDKDVILTPNKGQEMQEGAVKSPSSDTESSPTSGGGLTTSSEASGLDKGPKRRGPKPKNAAGGTAAKPVPSAEAKPDVEGTPKKRGPKPKRKVDEATDKSQADSESEVSRPKKKVRRKKGEKEESSGDVSEKESAKVKQESAGAIDKSQEPKLLQSAIDKYAFVDEEERVPLDTKPHAFASPSISIPAPQLVSVSATRASLEGKSDGELTLPQLSPQVPSTSQEENRCLQLPAPPVIPPSQSLALEEASHAAPADSSTQAAAGPSAPYHSPRAHPAHAQDEPAAEKLPTASRSSILLDNTPPDTPEGSPVMPGHPPPVGTSPSQEDSQSTESERDANMEVENLMQGPSMPPGGESPGPCDTSTISNGSGGSSGNAPGSESDEMGPTQKRKVEEEEVTEKPPPKRRKRGPHKRAGSDKVVKKSTASAKPTSEWNASFGDLNVVLVILFLTRSPENFEFPVLKHKDIHCLY